MYSSVQVNNASSLFGAATTVAQNTAAASSAAEMVSVSARDVEALNSRIVALSAKPVVPAAQDFAYRTKMAYEDGVAASTKRVNKVYASKPERTLDAPGLADDFYVNVMDWSAQNQIAVAFGADVWVWDANTNSAAQLCKDRAAPVRAVAWMQDGSHVAVAVDCAIELWNVESRTRVRTLAGRAAPITALAWNGSVLSAGALDGCVFHHDVRVKNHHFATLAGHEGAVCALKWNADGTLLASGGNDNTVRVWDAASTGAARHVFAEASAAVRALAWCPWQDNTLAAGAGSADRCIRLYNAATGALTAEMQTDSQVTAVVWAATEKELVSAHNNGKLNVWRCPSFVHVAELVSDSAARAVDMIASPDGTSVCVGAGEQLCFWRLWESSEAKLARVAAQQAEAKKALENPLR